MEEKATQNNNRLQNIIDNLAKLKLEFVNEKEECKKLREVNTKLEVELKEARELEKSHRYHLFTSREMIDNLQETVSQLVYLKRDIKKFKDDIILRDCTITSLEKEKENILQKHDENIIELRNSHQKYLEQLNKEHEIKIQQIHHDSETKIAQFTCIIEELQSRIRDIDTEHQDKMNAVVLEYEEKIQRSSAQVAQLQEQILRQAARTDANIEVYRKRLEELEEKLKQTHFKQYLAQCNYTTQYESQVERPFSVERDPYHMCAELEPSLEITKPKATSNFNVSQNKAPRSSTLQVMYYGDKISNLTKNTEKKGQFNITKRRKLYNEKDFQEF